MDKKQNPQGELQKEGSLPPMPPLLSTALPAPPSLCRAKLLLNLNLWTLDELEGNWLLDVFWIWSCMVAHEEQLQLVLHQQQKPADPWARAHPLSQDKQIVQAAYEARQGNKTSTYQ